MENLAVSEAKKALHSIEAFNTDVNAVFPFPKAEVLADAKSADEARYAGDWYGLLHGVPVTVKDCLSIAGKVTTYGNGAYRENVAERSSTAISRLQSSGCVFVGKNNLSEFCYGLTNENVHFGNCKNPWDLDRIPGGSSGGSAASVASGMCRVSIGSDTGGSVRVPAALCGVVGLRPTAGWIPNTEALEVSVLFDAIGPMAYSVVDVARAFAVMAGPDESDYLSAQNIVPNFLPTLRHGIANVKIGLPRRFYFEDVQPAVEENVLNAARELERAGAELIDIDVRDAELAQDHTMFSIILADMANVHGQRIAEDPASIGSEVLRRLRMGTSVSGADYSRSLRWVLKWKLVWRSIFENVDLVLTPTTPRTAPRRSDAEDMIAASKVMSRNSFGVGAVGLPAISLPCGFDGDGLPVGVQLIGSWYQEPLLFRAGVAFQARTDFHRARPALLKH